MKVIFSLFLRAMASNLRAMASTLVAMASSLEAVNLNGIVQAVQTVRNLVAKHG